MKGIAGPGVELLDQRGLSGGFLSQITGCDGPRLGMIYRTAAQSDAGIVDYVKYSL